MSVMETHVCSGHDVITGAAEALCSLILVGVLVDCLEVLLMIDCFHRDFYMLVIGLIRPVEDHSRSVIEPNQ
jgi:hypothetical protein